MRIFLSHRSRHKPLVNNFKNFLPPFLTVWLDEECLCWGESLQIQLKSAIESAVDFVVIFLDSETLNSVWVRQELNWAIQREGELARAFLLPIILPETDSGSLPSELSEKVYLRLSDYSRMSVEALARQATEKLFQLIVEDYSKLQLELPCSKVLTEKRNELSSGQNKILEYVVKQCQDDSEVTQRYIENAMQYAHTPSELFYRLETLIEQGFLAKRRISADGMFSYRMTKEFREIAES